MGRRLPNYSPTYFGRASLIGQVVTFSARRPVLAFSARRSKSKVPWFRELRDRICAAFEAVEDDLAGTHAEMLAGRFERTAWERPGGGGWTEEDWQEWVDWDVEDALATGGVPGSSGRRRRPVGGRRSVSQRRG